MAPGGNVLRAPCFLGIAEVIMERKMGILAAFWGIAGITVLLGSAIYRLAPYAVDLFTYELFWQHWLALIVNALFMAYAEGYRGFQQRFSPRVAARARYLRDHPRFLHAVFAPFFCMAFFHAPRGRKITSISLTAGIICLIILVRMLPPLWRGIVDIGVVIGLLWGVMSLLAYTFQAFTHEAFAYSPEIS